MFTKGNPLLRKDKYVIKKISGIWYSRQILGRKKRKISLFDFTYITMALFHLQSAFILLISLPEDVLRIFTS